MIVGFLIELAVGLTCVILGLLLWKKQKVSILHDYHYQHVKKEDIPAYSRQMGIGLILIGAGICLAGFANLAYRTGLSFLALGLGFAAGIFVMHRAQKKYNGSWLG